MSVPLGLGAEPSCSCGHSFEELHLTSLLFLFLSPFPTPEHTFLSVPGALATAAYSGEFISFSFHFHRVSSQMKKLKVLKNLRMSCLKHEVKPQLHGWCCLPLTSALKFKELGH